MTTWSPDICDCKLEMDRKTGEPVSFALDKITSLEVRCTAHAAATPLDVAKECRAKEASREAVRATLGLQEAPDWQRSKDGGHEIILPEGLDKTTTDRVTAAVAAVADPTLTKLTTVSEIAAATAEAAPAAGVKGA